LEKERLISKFNIKDYNNQLEKILTKKTFSEDTKNLLLNMLYRIENAYNDYQKVNVDVKNKKDILEEILNIIENDCETIDIIKENKSYSIREEKKIVTYLNANRMLYELYQIKNKKFNILDDYDITKKSIENTLNHAYSIASSEIIRDFDGWSWHIIVSEIENITANLIYKALKILVGNEFLVNWQENINNEDYIQKLLEKLEIIYKTELAEELFKTIKQLSILNYTNENQDERKRLIQVQENLQIEFEDINDKKGYLQKLADNKKKINAEIKNIDKLINDDKLLKREFIARNELLDMEHRIFSLSDFVDVLQLERNELIKELNLCSKKMEPLNFIKLKTELETNLIMLKELKLEKKDTKIYNQKIEQLLKLINKAIEVQINNLEEKEDIVKLIYMVRYYGLIYANKSKRVKDLINLNKIQKQIITEACKRKAITIFSKNIKENYEIVKNIFEIDIIELEKIYFKFVAIQEKILLEIYDEGNLYKTVELVEIEELYVKFNKKIKVINS